MPENGTMKVTETKRKQEKLGHSTGINFHNVCDI